jgi:hypothetical protein
LTAPLTEQALRRAVEAVVRIYSARIIAGLMRLDVDNGLHTLIAAKLRDELHGRRGDRWR